MPARLERRYDTRTSHFITCSCYQRRALLENDDIKQVFLKVLEETRREYDFCVYGYVLMPEHFHLLISKPEIRDTGTVLQVLKQRVSHEARKMLDPTLFQKKEKDGAPTFPDSTLSQRRRENVSATVLEVESSIEFEDLAPPVHWQFWQRRFYDFNVRSRHKMTEKLKYIHRNPVVRGLVTRPEDWRWSSFRHYAMGEIGPVEIESEWTALRREREVHVMNMPPR